MIFIKLLKNILLYILALIGLVLFLAIGGTYGIIRKPSISTLSDKFLDLAEYIDVYGAIWCAELFNDILITKDAIHKFGKGVTISATLGHNQHYNTLTKTGKWLVKQLDKIEANHCLIAAGYL